MDGMVLTSDNQKKIVTEIDAKLHEQMSKCELTGATQTFTPYFDVTLTEDQKSNLIEVPMSTLINYKVKND